MNYLLFVDGGDDAACYPANRLLGMTCAGDGELLLKFESSIGGVGSATSAMDKITLTITADKEEAVMTAIAQAANAPVNQGGVVTVCNDVTSEFLTSNILSCAILLDT